MSTSNLLLLALLKHLGLAHAQEQIREAPDPIEDAFGLLEHSALSIGRFFHRVSLKPQQLKDHSKRFHLVTSDQNGCWWLILAQGKDIYCYPDNTTPQRQSWRELNKSLGPETRLYLALEPEQTAAPHLSPRKRLFELLQPERGDLKLIVGYSLGMGVLGLSLPIAAQALVNTVAFGTLLQPLLVLTALVFLLLSVMALMRSFRLVLVEMLQRRVFVRVSQVTAARLQHVLHSHLEEKRLPELVNRFFDVITVQKSASLLLLDGLGLLLQTLTGLALLAFYHPIFLAFDLCLIAAFFVILYLMGWGAVRSSIQESGQKYALAAWLEELAVHPNLFKARDAQHYAGWKTEALLQNFLKARKQHFRVVLRQNVSAYALQAIGSAALLGLGGWLVIQGELSLGQLVAAELIVAGVLDSFSKLGKHLEIWYDLMAALDKIGYLYDLPQEQQRHNLLNHASPALALRMENVHYQHPHSLQEINISNWECGAGQHIGLYGADFWESHLFFELLYALRQAQNGIIWIGDQPLTQLMLSDYRSQVALVKDPQFFEGSLLENLRLNNRSLSRAKAQQLLQQVGLWNRICQLPDGLDTPLTWNGFPLSEPERYRAMFARALAQEPRLILVDTALDRLEWRDDGPLQETLFQNKNCTLIISTNRPEFLKYFDQVYTFSAGQLSLQESNHG